MKKSAQQLLGSLDSLLASVRNTKAAEANTEPGSVGGQTDHPIKSVEDGTAAAQEGARSAENTKDVKEKGPNMADHGGEKPAASSTGETPSTDIGPLEPKSTGTDAPVEQDFKDGKDDPGTTHDANTENDSITGGKKYASSYDQLSDLCKQAEVIGKAILADVATDATQPKQAGAAASASTPAPATQKTDAEKAAAQKEAEAAAQAGYDLAGVFAGLDVPVTDKQAADNYVVALTEHTIKQAIHDATNVGEYLQGFFANKQAGDEEGDQSAEESESESKDKGQPEGGNGGGENGGGEGGGDAGGAPAGAPLGDEGMPGEEELLSMLAGGGEGAPSPAGGMDGGAGAGGPMPGMGAPMPGADAGAGLPAPGGDLGGGGGDILGMLAGGGGGAPGAPGAGPGAPGAGGSPDDAALLQQIITELGLDPAMLQGKAAAVLARKQASAKPAATNKLAARKQAMTRMLLDLSRNG